MVNVDVVVGEESGEGDCDAELFLEEPLRLEDIKESTLKRPIANGDDKERKCHQDSWGRAASQRKRTDQLPQDPSLSQFHTEPKFRMS